MNFLNRIRNIWSLGGSLGNGGGIYDFFATRGLSTMPDITFNFKALSGMADAYNKCNSLRSIINKNSNSLINGHWWIVDDKDNDVIDKYDNIKLLIGKPNPLQTWSEFIVLLDTYRQVYGESYVYAVVPVGFDVAQAAALWVIDPTKIDIELTGNMYMQGDIADVVRGYYLSDGVKRIKLDNRCIMHVRDLTANIDFGGDNVRGSSRLCGLENTIRNIVQGEEAIYALTKDRGAQGMLVNKSKDVTGNIPLLPAEKERVQREYKLKYGVSVNQDKVLITDADLQWQQMTFNVKDLMLFEGMESNIQRIADAFDMPFELLASPKGQTYANKLEAKRYHYQNNIIPLSKYYAELFTKFFGLDKDKFVIDFSDVECLRKTEQERADMLYKTNQAYKIAKDAGVVSTAEWRLAIGLDEEIYKPDEIEELNQNEESENTAKERGGDGDNN